MNNKRPQYRTIAEVSIIPREITAAEMVFFWTTVGLALAALLVAAKVIKAVV